MTARETAEVSALYAGVRRILDTEDDQGRKVGDCRCGVYLFYDYDAEPIYVGQTRESLQSPCSEPVDNAVSVLYKRHS